MNADRGYFCMPPAELGLYFPGITALLKAKLAPRVSKKLVLEAHRFTGKEAEEDGVVDHTVPKAVLEAAALALADRWKGKAKAGVYHLLRADLMLEPLEQFQRLSSSRNRSVVGDPSKL